MLIPIGQFAQASGLTITALRHYDDSGVLVPAHVDPSNGYRYYHPEQVESAQLVRLLRRLELPLDELRDLLTKIAEGTDVSAVLTRLADQVSVAEHRLGDHRDVLQDVRDRLTQQDRTLDINVRRVDRGPALARRATIDYTDYLAFMADSYQQLYTVAGNGPIAVSGSPYARYQGQLDVGESTEVEACLPFWAGGAKPRLTGDVFVLEPRAELFASAVFVGPATVFPAVHQAYDAVAGWILRHGFEFASPAYEIYRLWHGEAGHPDNRLEIGWAVAENAT